MGIAIIGAVGLVFGKAIASQFAEHGTSIFLLFFVVLAAGLWLLLRKQRRKIGNKMSEDTRDVILFSQSKPKQDLAQK